VPTKGERQMPSQGELHGYRPSSPNDERTLAGRLCASLEAAEHGISQLTQQAGRHYETNETNIAQSFRV
jgi:hypothetical protein